MSKLPLNVAALEAERTRATKAFLHRQPATDTDSPTATRRRRHALLNATSHLERPCGGDAA